MTGLVGLPTPPVNGSSISVVPIAPMPLDPRNSAAAVTPERIAELRALADANPEMADDLYTLFEFDEATARATQVRGENEHLDRMARSEEIRLLAQQEARRRVAARSASPWTDELYDIADLDQMPDLVPLVHGWLNRDSDARMFGPSGEGKSFLALDLALCIATGRAWHGSQVEPGRVLYVAAEGARGLRKRVQAWTARHGVTPARGMLTIKGKPIQLAAPDDLVTAAGEHRYALVVLDTQARVTVGLEENSASDTAVMTEALRRIREASGGAAVMLVHHSGHGAGRARGSSAGTAAMDTELSVSRDDGVIKLSTRAEDGGKQKDDTGQSLEFELQPVDGTDSVVPVHLDPLSAGRRRRDLVPAAIVPVTPGVPDGAGVQEAAAVFQQVARDSDGIGPDTGLSPADLRREMRAQAIERLPERERTDPKARRRVADTADKQANEAFRKLRGGGFIESVTGSDAQNTPHRWVPEHSRLRRIGGAELDPRTPGQEIRIDHGISAPNSDSESDPKNPRTAGQAMPNPIRAIRGTP